jgi:arylsulfatase A-like enzyme
LLSLPDQTRRIDVEQVVSLIDVGPTLLDLAGIARPLSFEGGSLRATIEAVSGWRARLARAAGLEQTAGERAAFSELLAVPVPGGGRLTPHVRSIVLGDRKLIERVDHDREVFDLRLDPHERQARPPDRDDVAVLVPALERLGPVAPAAPGILDRDTERRLRALGYLR